MAREQTQTGGGSRLSHFIAQWSGAAIPAAFGLIAGISLAAFNSGLDTNRFFLERQAKTADSIAVEFSRYVENWSRLIRLRKEFDAKKAEPSAEEREYFKRVVFERADARDKLFSSLDAAHLYYSHEVSKLVVKFREWDNQQSEVTIDRLPDIKEWRAWQIDILRALQKEISK